MVKDFCDKLEGFYDNWHQAASNPSKYAHCKLRWERLSDNELKSKQWYHYMCEDHPYRQKWHRVHEQQGIIIVQNWTPEWGEHNHCCDMMSLLLRIIMTVRSRQMLALSMEVW